MSPSRPPRRLGTIRDDVDTANGLFVLVIVEDRITRPRHITEMYTKLPAGKLQGILDRNSPRAHGGLAVAPDHPSGQRVYGESPCRRGGGQHHAGRGSRPASNARRRSAPGPEASGRLRYSVSSSTAGVGFGAGGTSGMIVTLIRA
jgi:hypothetical protein